MISECVTQEGGDINDKLMCRRATFFAAADAHMKVKHKRCLWNVLPCRPCTPAAMAQVSFIAKAGRGPEAVTLRENEPGRSKQGQ